MQSNTHIVLNMQSPNVAVVVNAKQGDKLSRVITADLVDGDIPFVPPAGVAAAVRYFKPDNTVGFYDVTEDNTAAVVLDGSTATVTLAEQALTVPGNVYAEINFYTASEKLTSFSFIIAVQKSAVSDQMIESTDYFSVLTQQINALLGATANPPYINATDKNWMVWDEDTGAYVDSGYSSIGTVPPSTVTYQAGNSGTTPPTGTWLSTIPVVAQGEYLWTRTQFDFSDGTQQTSYSVARQGMDGAGSVVTVNGNSPDASGNVYVQTVNPNLLDNWYFVGGGSQQGGGQFPVNQRGQTEYTGAVNYTVDRWRNEYVTGTVKVSGSGLILSETALTQPIDIPLSTLSNKKLTLSVLLNNGNLHSTTGVVPTNLEPWAAAILAAFGEGNEQFSLSIQYTGSFLRFVIDCSATASSAIDIVAVKLEFGNAQTLAHQENGVWVLNEIPNFAEEFMRCSRFCKRIKDIDFLLSTENQGYYRSGAIYVGEMRTTPAITYLANDIGNMGIVEGVGFIALGAIGTTISANASGFLMLYSNLETYAGRQVRFYDILLSADL